MKGETSVISKILRFIEFIVQNIILGSIYWVVSGFLYSLLKLKGNFLEISFTYIISYTLFFYFIIDKVGNNKVIGTQTRYIKGVMVIVTFILLIYFLGEVRADIV